MCVTKLENTPPTDVNKLKSSIVMSSLLTIFFLINALTLVTNEMQQGSGINWYESLPAVAMDYKIFIDAGEN
jgi:hypothetical protein